MNIRSLLLPERLKRISEREEEIRDKLKEVSDLINRTEVKMSEIMVDLNTGRFNGNNSVVFYINTKNCQITHGNE